jgi:hypothetical protein
VAIAKAAQVIQLSILLEVQHPHPEVALPPRPASPACRLIVAAIARRAAAVTLSGLRAASQTQLKKGKLWRGEKTERIQPYDGVLLADTASKPTLTPGVWASSGPASA